MQHFGFNPALDILIAVVLSLFGSTGFWVYIQKRQDRKSANTRLLLGMAHDRIVYVGKTYIHRGFLTLDEYEDFMKYLYEPYAEFGGNGLAERIVEEVKRLPVVPSSRPIARKKSDDR
nr:MAG TPA: holin protein [Caudoviricetes sp.]